MRERYIGTYGGYQTGPLLFVLGGIHGNEPAGVFGLEKVFQKLEAQAPHFRGKLVGICGNCRALAKKQRFIDRDLNRLWSEREIQRILHSSSKEALNSEEKELLEILSVIEKEKEGDFTARVMMDLHTTSAPGGFFSIVTPKPRNRELGTALYAPVIFNLNNSLDSTTNIFMDNHGWQGVAFESGQHDDIESMVLHEAAVWVMLEKVGCIHRDDIDKFQQYHVLLAEAAKYLPRFVNVVYRHEITPEDQFSMVPGYVNFTPVKAGELLGRDRKGMVKAPKTGRILMPLYQPQGEEGFFIAEELEKPLI